MLKVKEGIKNLEIIFNTHIPPHKDGLRVIGIWPNDEIFLKRGTYLKGWDGPGWFFSSWHKYGAEHTDPILWADVSQVYDAIEKD